jgi:hypothetical protein
MTNHTKPARAGKKKWRPEKNPGVDSRDQRGNQETPQKPAQGLRELRGISRDEHLCHCKPKA